MHLSIPKDASDAPEDVASEEDSKSFPIQEDSETAALVRADPLANIKAHLKSLALIMDLSIHNDASDCYYGETLVTKGSLLELWYSGRELQLALFPESNGSLVSATRVPRDSFGIRGTNTPSRTDSVG
jgi:hypothetical protein